jgi:hypothetical protein
MVAKFQLFIVVWGASVRILSNPVGVTYGMKRKEVTHKEGQ